MRTFTFRENLILAKTYFFQYGAISNLSYKSLDEIQKIQFDKIKKLVTLAYNETDFYKRKYSDAGLHPEDIKNFDDFSRIPTISKSDVIKHNVSLVVNNRKCRKNIFVSKSSGSSGQVVDIFFDVHDRISLALIYLRILHQSYAYEPFDKMAYISTSEYPYVSILGMYKRTYLYTLTPHSQLMQQLEQLRPAVICSYPSILLDLISKHRAKCEQMKLKAVFTNSEQSTQEQRDFIGSIFNCRVYDEYSSEELQVIAHQCRNFNYHIQEDCAYIEIMDPDSDKVYGVGQTGEIVGTCLINDTMPIIRYRQGDLASLVNVKCSCKQNGRILSGIAGRKNSSFILADGSTIPSGKILDWTYSLILNHKLPIVQFQIIQRMPEEVEVVIVPHSSYNEHTDDRIVVDSFRRQFGGIRVTSVKKVQEIPRTAAGKHIPIKSFVKGSPEGK